MNSQDRYKQAGVDIEKGNQFVRNIGQMVRGTHQSAVLGDLGGFSGLFSLNPQQYPNPVLVSSTDGVGTKLKIAFMMGKHDTVGIDLVGMVINDIAVCGARPLFMLDYLATGRLELGVAEAIIAGIVEGCHQAKCSLIGGETAEMPGMYADGEYDLAGFAVGVVSRDEILDGSTVSKDSALVGIASSGLHSNGYSLVRQIVFGDLGLKIDSPVAELGGRTVGEELITPTRIYSEALLNIKRDYQLQAAAHITGGGLLENLPRVFPQGLKAILQKDSWDTPPVFQWLREAGGLDQAEMLRTFNSGLGMVMSVPQRQAGEVCDRLGALGFPAWVVGHLEPRRPEEPSVVLAES